MMETIVIGIALKRRVIKMEFLYFMVNVVVIVLIGSFLFKLIERMFDNEV